MSNQTEQHRQETAPPTAEITRPLYIRHVPEPTWNRVHENALKSRMRLSAYLVKLMEESQPYPPQPLVKRPRRETNPQQV
jgi:hypothetical protein